MRTFLVAAALCWTVGAHAAEWDVDKKADANRVEFTSEVVGFSFNGHTDRIDGYIYWEGEEIFGDACQLLFQVELNALDTGIGKRDRDMRRVLGTDEWPEAVFKGTIVEHAVVDTTVEAYRVVARGKLSLHGVERELTVPGTVVLEQGGPRVTAAFTVRLADHQIEAPSLAAFVKVSQEVRVSVDFRMKPVN